MTAGPSQLFFRISVFNQFKFDLPKPPQVDKIRGLITTIKNNGVGPDGTITEEIADLLFHGKDGYFRQNGKLGSNNGFDGLFIKPAIDFTKPIDEIDIEGIIINESKQTGGGGFRMNGEGQKLPMQMDWVDDVILRLTKSKDPEQVKLAQILRREFNANPSKFIHVVTGVETIEETVGIVKLN